MRFYVAIFLFIFLNPSLYAQHICKKKSTPLPLNSSTNADSIDILHYTIDLDFTDFSNQNITGNTQIKLTPRTNNVNQIRLDLLELSVDSVKINNQPLQFSYNDSLLKVLFPTPYTTNDTINLFIYYNGSPVQDSQGEGGFYFDGSYAYNIGVFLNDIPHNAGKVWFPCFDDFTERSTYSFYIKTSNGKKAHCNGYLANEQIISGDTIIRHWEMGEEIPTYLACVAIGDYSTVSQIHNGNFGSIPIELAAHSSDTSDVKLSFQNLGNAINIYEEKFGMYKWNKVGYNIVPFPYGAMEHATSIAYQRALINGLTTYETVMAHELAHSWWGNLVTCHDATEMWLNEGWASYAEHIFLEELYGKASYWDAVHSNHLDVIQNAHRQEEGYHALSNVPLNQTYGIHSYQKGAMVVHNLRTYLSDSLFYDGIRAFIANNNFKEISSNDLQNFLSTYSSIDLSYFFNGWVFNPGFPNFQIDSFEYQQINNDYEIDIHIKQYLQSAPSFFENVPMMISILGNNFESYDTTIQVSGEYHTFNFTLPFEPNLIYLNKNNGILGATTSEEKIIKTTGSSNFNRAKMSLQTHNLISDSIFVRIERNWVSPDPTNKESDLRLSKSHSWSVKSNMSSNDHISGHILYSKFFDNDLISINEDSLVLAYRKDGTQLWKLYNNFTKDINNSNQDGYGTISIDSLISGEYCLANSNRLLNTLRDLNSNEIKVFPNILLNEETINITNLDKNERYTLTISDMKGSVIYRKVINSKHYDFVQLKNLVSNTYILNIYNSNGLLKKNEKITISK